MQNCARGSLKIRGTRDKLLRFLKEGLSAVSSQSKQNQISIIKEDDLEIVVFSPEGIVVEGTTKAFIQDDIYWYLDNSEKEIISISSFEQENRVSAEEFLALAKKYGIDFNLYAFEEDMMFHQLIEIINGEIVTNKTVPFNF